MSLCDNIMKFCVFLTLLICVHGNGSADYENSLYKDAIQFVHECGSRTLSLCFKEKALNYIEQLPNNFDIGNGIRIVENDAVRLPRQHSPITLPNETSAREAVLDKVLFQRIADYLRSHTFEFKMSLDALKNSEMPIEEGRRRYGDDDRAESKDKGGGYGGGGYGGGKKGGKKGKKGYGLMMMMMSFKAATIGAMALKAIAAIAFKALIAAKIALTIALAVTLKKLFEQKHHTSTYEVVAHPHHVHEDYGHGHHDRSYTQDMAYNGYKYGS